MDGPFEPPGVDLMLCWVVTDRPHPPVKRLPIRFTPNRQGWQALVALSVLFAVTWHKQRLVRACWLERDGQPAVR